MAVVDQHEAQRFMYKGFWFVLSFGSISIRMAVKIILAISDVCVYAEITLLKIVQVGKKSRLWLREFPTR